MSTNLSIATAFGMLKTIEQYTPADFDVLGITQENFELVSGPLPWRREQMGLIMRTMNAILFGSCEIMGLPKLIVPSEYVAAHIAAIVNPANKMQCCIMMATERQTGVGALELASRQHSPSSYDPSSADNLFALVCILSDSDEANYARQRFRKRLGLRIEEAMKGTMQ